MTKKTKKINFQTFIDQAINDVFNINDDESENVNADRIYDMVKQETKELIRESAKNIILEAFSLEYDWKGLFRIRYEDKFMDTKIGKFIFSDIQDAIIEELHKVDPKTLSNTIEKTISKNAKNIIEKMVYDQCIDFMSKNINNKIDELVHKIIADKLENIIETSIKNSLHQNKAHDQN